MTNPETDLIHAPWSAGQVTALNAFQHHGRMHPFTCGATHASGQSPVLVATHSGWVCPDPQCVYRQDWAHAFMAEGVPVRIVTVPPTAAVSVPPPAPRADDLRWAADWLLRVNPDRGAEFSEGVDWAVDELRRLAAEPVPCVAGEQQNETPEAEQPRVVRCSRAILSRPHEPHGWYPQPGMDPVDCPGHSFTEASE